MNRRQHYRTAKTPYDFSAEDRPAFRPERLAIERHLTMMKEKQEPDWFLRAIVFAIGALVIYNAVLLLLHHMH